MQQETFHAIDTKVMALSQNLTVSLRPELEEYQSALRASRGQKQALGKSVDNWKGNGFKINQICAYFDADFRGDATEQLDFLLYSVIRSSAYVASQLELVHKYEMQLNKLTRRTRDAEDRHNQLVAEFQGQIDRLAQQQAELKEIKANNVDVMQQRIDDLKKQYGAEIQSYKDQIQHLQNCALGEETVRNILGAQNVKLRAHQPQFRYEQELVMQVHQTGIWETVPSVLGGAE